MLELVPGGDGRVGAREGFLVIAVLWLLVSACGALPYLLSGEDQLSSPVDAYFEAVSGFTTTSSSVVTDVDSLPRSLAMWRQFTVWLGGVGIIVLALAVLPRLRVAGRQLFEAEVAGPEAETLTATIRATARRFLRLYVALTALMILTLGIVGWTGLDDRMTLYEAVAHTFTTLGTGGFSTQPRSMEAFAPVTQWIVVAFLIAAGTNYALMFQALVRRRLAPFARDQEFRLYLVILLARLAAAARRAAGRGDRTRGGGRALRRLPDRLDHDDDRLRQRRLQQLDGADERDDRRAHVLRRLRGLDDRLDQGRPAPADRQDPAPRAGAHGAPRARQLRCG